MLQIARTELLEHRRQRWMLFILAFSYTIWFCVYVPMFYILDSMLSQPERLSLFQEQMAVFGLTLEAFLQAATSALGLLLFTNLPLFVSIMSGYSVLNDRTCGTLPFLMLAPISRRDLLMGKLGGAMTIPLLLHFFFVGTTSLILGRLELLSPYADKLGGSLAWWIAFLLGAPLSAAFVGAVGTVISALSHDVRTSMQFISFFVGLLSAGIGLALVQGISHGPWLQLLFAASCAVATFLTLLVGARLISRDITLS